MRDDDFDYLRRDISDLHADLRDMRHTVEEECNQLRVDLDTLKDAITRAAYDLGCEHPGNTIEGMVNALIDMARNCKRKDGAD